MAKDPKDKTNRSARNAKEDSLKKVAKASKPKLKNKLPNIPKKNVKAHSRKAPPPKPSSKSQTASVSPNKWEAAVKEANGWTAPLPTRNKKGELVFEGHPELRPNMTPKEVLQAGSFGGTYFRPIKSGVTGQKYSGVWKELPKDWLEGLEVSKQVASSAYRESVNTYKVKCGGSLEMWESSGWIDKQDPYGWFMWYCRFYLGRRTADDERQIGRWNRCAGVKGRWRNNLIAKCARSGCAFDNFGISPVVRQTLQHWGYRLTKEDFDKAAKRFK